MQFAFGYMYVCKYNVPDISTLAECNANGFGSVWQPLPMYFPFRFEQCISIFDFQIFFFPMCLSFAFSFVSLFERYRFAFLQSAVFMFLVSLKISVCNNWKILSICRACVPRSSKQQLTMSTLQHHWQHSEQKNCQVIVCRKYEVKLQGYVLGKHLRYIYMQMHRLRVFRAALHPCNMVRR